MTALTKNFISMRKHSGFRRHVDGGFFLMVWWAVNLDICLSTFRDSISVPSSKDKQSLF